MYKLDFHLLTMHFLKIPLSAKVLSTICMLVLARHEKNSTSFNRQKPTGSISPTELFSFFLPTKLRTEAGKGVSLTSSFPGFNTSEVSFFDSGASSGFSCLDSEEEDATGAASFSDFSFG